MLSTHRLSLTVLAKLHKGYEYLEALDAPWRLCSSELNLLNPGAKFRQSQINSSSQVEVFLQKLFKLQLLLEKYL